MARSTKSYEERLLQLEKREQESLEKAKQYAAQKRELKKRQKDVETKKRTHRLCQIGGAVESVIGSAIEEEDIPKLVGFLKRQEANGKFFSKAMQKVCAYACRARSVGGHFMQTCSCRRRHSSPEGRIPCRLLCTEHSYAEGVPADTILFYRKC